MTGVAYDSYDTPSWRVTAGASMTAVHVHDALEAANAAPRMPDPMVDHFTNFMPSQNKN